MSAEKMGKRWRARIYVRGNSVHVGMFDTKEEALEACEHAKMYNSYTFVEDWDTSPREGLVLRTWNRLKDWYRG